MRSIAIIPARGGSKGIPHKNIIDFCGYPLIAWTIACARRCNRIDEVYVSTDDDAIAAVAERYGATIIHRPAEIAGDRATSESALIHAYGVIKSQQEADAIVFLQATSPLRETSELDEGLKDFELKSLDSMFSAAEPEDFLMWMEEGGQLQSLNYDFRNRLRRQDSTGHKRLWIETGSFYISKAASLISSGNRLGGRIGLLPVQFWKSFEVDSMDSLRVCESLMRQYGLNQTIPSAVL